MSRYFIRGATAAWAVMGLRKGTSSLIGAIADAVAGCAYNPFKFFRLAMRTFKLHFVLFVHHQYFKAVITF
jgi:hypothetical protein